MTTHTIEVSGADDPGDRDWIRLAVELPLDRTRAFELAQTISATGTSPHVRVLNPQGVRVLMMSHLRAAS